MMEYQQRSIQKCWGFAHVLMDTPDLSVNIMLPMQVHNIEVMWTHSRISVLYKCTRSHRQDPPMG